MKQQQLIFGLICGGVIASSGAMLAQQAVVSWLFSLCGVALIVLNLVVWLVRPRSAHRATPSLASHRPAMATFHLTTPKT